MVMVSKTINRDIGTTTTDRHPAFISKTKISVGTSAPWWDDAAEEF